MTRDEKTRVGFTRIVANQQRKRTMANLLHVDREWRTRNPHERYYDIADVLPDLEKQERYQREYLVPMDEIKALSKDDELYVEIPGVASPVRLNNWSFESLLYEVDKSLSAKELRKFPADLIVPLVQHQLEHNSGVSNIVDEPEAEEEVDPNILALYGETAQTARKVDSRSRQVNILVAPNGSGLYARSVNSSSYGRYHDLELARDALQAVEAGWRTPRAMAVGNNPFNDVSRYGENHRQADRLATKDDLMACSMVTEGMRIGPAGVYRGDRNFFIFLASDIEILPDHYRFVTLENSEVGESRKLRATFGLMNRVCMNHILWDVSNVHMVEKKHRRGSVGKFRDEFAESLSLVTRAEGIPMKLYQLAKSREFGKDKAETVKAVYSRRLPGLTQDRIERAFDAAIANPGDADGAPPTSYWGIVQGLTRVSQALPYADRRMDVDRASGELLNELKIDDASTSEGVTVEVLSDGTVETHSPKRGRKSK